MQDDEPQTSTTASDSQPDPAAAPPSRHTLWIKLAIAAAFVAGILVLSLKIGNAEILNYLAAKESQAQSFRTQHPVGVYAAAFLIYVAVTGLSLPGAAPLSILYGWFFDLLPAFVLISFASTTGATLAFLLSRYFLRHTIQASFAGRLKTFNEALQREGAWYLFTLRLIPAVPFFIINLVMGLTPLRVTTFWWVSQLGMLPGTFVYTYAGHSFPQIGKIQEIAAKDGFRGLLTHSSGDFNPFQLLVALTLLGLLPVVLKFVIKKLKPSAVNEPHAAE